MEKCNKKEDVTIFLVRSVDCPGGTNSVSCTAGQIGRLVSDPNWDSFEACTLVIQVFDFLISQLHFALDCVKIG